MHTKQEKDGAEYQKQLHARDLYEKGIRLSMVKPNKPNLKKAVTYFTQAADLGHANHGRGCGGWRVPNFG